MRQARSPHEAQRRGFAHLASVEKAENGRFGLKGVSTTFLQKSQSVWSTQLEKPDRSMRNNRTTTWKVTAPTPLNHITNESR